MNLPLVDFNDPVERRFALVTMLGYVRGIALGSPVPGEPEESAWSHGYDQGVIAAHFAPEYQNGSMKAYND